MGLLHGQYFHLGEQSDFSCRKSYAFILASAGVGVTKKWDVQKDEDMGVYLIKLVQITVVLRYTFLLYDSVVYLPILVLA